MKEKKDPMIELREEIQRIEERQTIEAQILREQFNKTCESLRPMNIIKTTFREAVNDSYLRSNVGNAVVSFSMGYFARRMLGFLKFRL